MPVRYATIILAIAIGTPLLGTTTFAQMSGPQRASSTQKRTPPLFEDFPVVEEFHSEPARVDLSSHPIARTFRTRLRDGARQGPNFAGHYALVWWGCGNECQGSLVIDLRTGKVYGPVAPPSELPSASTGRKKEMLESSRGIDFRLTSKLLIADPPCPKDYNPCVSFGRSEEPVRYYIMERDGLRLIHTTPCKLVNEPQQCRD
jgi:hypothetical protein